jgi:hypothetical protein
MIYTEKTIKKDIVNLSDKEFYIKYILRAENWYFEKILNIAQADIVRATDDFKLVVSNALHIGFNDVMMVGSGKTGYSFSPAHFLRPFELEGDNQSDIDIAVISWQLFDHFWRLFRQGYDVTNHQKYRYISREIYRGYISDHHLNTIDACRISWQEMSNESTIQLQRSMYFKHEIHYRIYRNWGDLEEYHLQSIADMKGASDYSGK